MGWVNRHGHVMSRWSAWSAAPGTADKVRSRICLDRKCGYSETQWRKVKTKKRNKP